MDSVEIHCMNCNEFFMNVPVFVDTEGYLCKSCRKEERMLELEHEKMLEELK